MTSHSKLKGTMAGMLAVVPLAIVVIAVLLALDSYVATSVPKNTNTTESASANHIVETRTDVKPALPVDDTPAVAISAVNPYLDEALPEVVDLIKEDGESPKKIQYELVQRPADGVLAAMEDILKVPTFDQKYIRYLWYAQPTASTEGELSYTLNTCISQAQHPYRPVRLSDNLFRLDLRGLCPDEPDLKRILTLWETKLPTADFRFHTIRDQEIEVVEKKKVKEKKTVPDTKTVQQRNAYGQLVNVLQSTTKEVEVEVEKDVKVKKTKPVSEFAIHTGLDKMLLLASLTESKAPILYGPDFLIKALTTIDGGLYYDFVNMPRNVPGKTDLDAFIELLGGQVNRDKRKEGASFVGLYRSKVTNKPRQVEYFYGTTSRPSNGPQLITITHDLADEDVDPKKHPIRNLLNFQGSAYEVIGVRNNGTFLYSLYDAQQKLLDEAPPNVVRDNIPAPYPARLQSAISCIRCHGPEDGRRAVANDVKKILKGNLDVFDDESSKDGVQKTMDTLVGMYNGDLTYPLMVTRNLHANSVFVMTKGLSVPSVSASLGQFHIDYSYGPITPMVALADLGYKVRSEDDAVRLFQRILPPLPPAGPLKISGEDPVIGTLREWDAREPVNINRVEWQQVLSDALLRVVTEEANIRISNPGMSLHSTPILKDAELIHRDKDKK